MSLKRRSKGQGLHHRQGSPKGGRSSRRGVATRRETILDLVFVTPAFVTGTGEHAAPVGISTIRELLRWWYRALVGHEAVLGLVDVEQAEAGVFGSPRLKIRSPLQIQVVPGTSFGVIPAGSPAPSSGIILDTTPKLDSIHYLASGPVGPVARRECDDHGVANEAAFNDPATGKAKRGQILRQPAIAVGTTFTVHLSWNDGALDDRQQEDLIRAAASLVALGGIGSRSKKGFGALAGAIDAAEIPEARSWWESQTYGILHGPTLSATAGFPSFPCLAYGIIRPDPVVSSTWEHAMGRLGQLYLAIRPRGAAAWIGGSAHPKRDSSVLFSVLSEEEGFRGVATLLPYVQPGEEGARELRDYVSAFKEFCWPEEG